MKIKDLKLDENQIITRILYKPNWYVRFQELCNYDNYEIIVYHKNEPDASKFKTNKDYLNYDLLNKTDTIVNRAAIHRETFNKMIANDFFNFVFEQIRTAEMHEIKEWFKVDGKYLKNPHPIEMTDQGISESECFTS